MLNIIDKRNIHLCIRNTEAMERRFIEQLFKAHQETKHIPSPTQVCKVLTGLLQVLFPELSDQRFDTIRQFEQYYFGVRLELNQVLSMLGDELNGKPADLENAIMERLPEVREMLMTDAEAINRGDPAAVSVTEVIRTYPGFYAMAVYRLAHELLQMQIPLIPRILTEHAHTKTGIEIHPGAEIGTGFCIDHGTGIVIGETAEIGNDVKMYQGVTLGALSVKKEMAKTKRHPTIGDRVIIYAGATILGGETLIGHDSIIGGSVWLTKSIPPHSRIYYQGGYLNQMKNGGAD